MSSPVRDIRPPTTDKNRALASLPENETARIMSDISLVTLRVRTPLRVLVVDDEPSIVATMGLIFEQRGFEVLTACSAGDAKSKLLADGDFDLVVTDMSMETEFAGYEVLEAADRRQSGPQVLILTGYPQGAADWKEKGASALLAKPAHPSELLQIVNTLLNTA